MKKLIIFLLMLCPIVAWAQDLVATDSVVPMKTVFAELLGYNTNVLGLGKNAKVEVDFGGQSGWWNDGRDLLVDENGKDIKFNSMVDAMNYMGERGWTFEAAYVVTVSNQNVIHWLMSKEIPMEADSREGIQQRRDVKKDKKKEKKKDKKQRNYDDAIY